MLIKCLCEGIKVFFNKVNCLPYSNLKVIFRKFERSLELANGFCAIADNRFVSEPGSYRSRSSGRAHNRAGRCQGAKKLGPPRNQRRRDDRGYAARWARTGG